MHKCISASLCVITPPAATSELPRVYMVRFIGQSKRENYKLQRSRWSVILTSASCNLIYTTYFQTYILYSLIVVSCIFVGYFLLWFLYKHYSRWIDLSKIPPGVTSVWVCVCMPFCDRLCGSPPGIQFF